MKNAILNFTIPLILCCSACKKECPDPVGSNETDTRPNNTVILQPGSEGKDSYVVNISPSVNYGSDEKIYAECWTYSGSNVIIRAYLDFDFSSIPIGAQIQSAKLSLFADTSNVFVGVPSGEEKGHSILSGSNDCSVKRVTSSWDENTLNWNNQPSFDDVNKVTIPSSINYEQAYTIDVIQMVKDQVANPSLYHGFLLQLNNESPYRRMIFYSGDGSFSDLRPKLEITYKK